MKADLYDLKGKRTSKKVTLEPDVFEASVNEALISQAVIIYLANQRVGSANTKSRGEIRGGGKKPWRQKGTGRARHGSIRSPIWKGGGVAFGPKAYKKRRYLSKKMRAALMRSVFSKLAKENSIIIFEDIKLAGKRLTKEINDIIANAGIEDKVLIVLSKKNDTLLKAAKNVQSIRVEGINTVNAYQLLRQPKVILMKDTLETINQKWGSKNIKVKE